MGISSIFVFCPLLEKLSIIYHHKKELAVELQSNQFYFVFISGRFNNTYKSRKNTHFIHGKCGTNIRLSIWNNYFIFYIEIFGPSYNFMFNLGTIDDGEKTVCKKIKHQSQQ